MTISGPPLVVKTTSIHPHLNPSLALMVKAVAPSLPAVQLSPNFGHPHNPAEAGVYDSDHQWSPYSYKHCQHAPSPPAHSGFDSDHHSSSLLLAQSLLRNDSSHDPLNGWAFSSASYDPTA